jgi:hypothetical protein
MPTRPEIHKRWLLLKPYLDQRQRSLLAAAEAEAIGYGGCVLVSQITGLSIGRISARKSEIRLTRTALAGSLVHRRKCGKVGRKLGPPLTIDSLLVRPEARLPHLPD